jgi:DNA-binding transcriptional ArsR family regulator
MSRVPATVRPDLPVDVEKAIDALGNRVRVAVLRSLLRDGPATRSQLAERLRVSKSLLQSHLAKLEDLGVIVRHAPGADSDHRARIFTAEPKRIQRLLETLVGTLQR